MHPWSFYEMGAEEVLNYYYYYYNWKDTNKLLW